MKKRSDYITCPNCKAPIPRERDFETLDGYRRYIGHTCPECVTDISDGLLKKNPPPHQIIRRRTEGLRQINGLVRYFSIV